jgi:hypothetical protein
MKATDLLGFTLFGARMRSLKKMETVSFVSIHRAGAACRGGRPKDVFSRTDLLSGARTSPRMGVRMGKGQT